MADNATTAYGFEMGEMNQRYASDWLNHLQNRQAGDNAGLMPPMGSLGGLKCDGCRMVAECDGFYCLAPVSMAL